VIIEELTVTAFQQHTRVVVVLRQEWQFVSSGDEADRIVAILEEHNLELQAITLTHAHLDHVGGVAALKSSDQWRR